MRSDYLEFFKTDNTVIETPRLRIRRMAKRDRNDMYEYASRDIVTRYLLWRTHPDDEHTKRYIDYVVSLYKSGQFFDFAIEYRENSKMIGTCGFTSFDLHNNSAEVGYVLNRSFWGQEIALEALTKIIEFGFSQLMLHRIEAKFIAENEKSLRVMEKCSMKFEGIRRSSYVVKGEYRDIGICSIISDEYYKEKNSLLNLEKKTYPEIY